MPEMSINSGNSDRVPYIKLYQKNGLNAVFKPFLLGRGRRMPTAHKDYMSDKNKA